MRSLDPYENVLLAGMSQAGSDTSLKGGAGLLPSHSTANSQQGKQQGHCMGLFVQQAWSCRLGKQHPVLPPSSPSASRTEGGVRLGFKIKIREK